MLPGKGPLRAWRPHWPGVLSADSLGAPVPVQTPSRADAPQGYFARLTEVESGGNPNAQTSTSSAFGPAQFTRGTWSTTIDRHPELGLTADDWHDPSKHGPALQALTADNARTLASSGLDASPTNLFAEPA